MRIKKVPGCTDPLTPKHMHVHKPVHTCSSPHISSPAGLELALNGPSRDCSDWLTFKLCNESCRFFLCPRRQSWILKLPQHVFIEHLSAESIPGLASVPSVILQTTQLPLFLLSICSFLPSLLHFSGFNSLMDHFDNTVTPNHLWLPPNII